ncbi:MAG: hypothetical protein RLZZ513_18 [Pseudomonadota bacterium]
MHSIPDSGTPSHSIQHPPVNRATQSTNVNVAPVSATVSPQINNVNSAQDPRGTKRELEQHDDGVIESAGEPALKRARTGPASVDSPIQTLFQAIEQGDLDRLKELLREAPTLRSALHLDFFGATPLGFAAKCGQEQIVEFLLRSDAPVNAKDTAGCTPLMYAAANGHVGIISQLRNFQAHIDEMTPDGSMNALMFALEYKQLEACKYLLHSGANINQLLQSQRNSSGGLEITTSLLSIIREDFAALIKYLLDIQYMAADSCALDTRSWNQVLVLHIAAEYGAVNVVQLFLERGADINRPIISKNGKKYNDLTEFALARRDYRLLECIAPFLAVDKVLEVIRNPTKNAFGKDILSHVGTWSSAAGQLGDGVKLVEVRDNPKKMVEKVACAMTLDNLAKGHSLVHEALSLSNEWANVGLLRCFLRPIDKISPGNLKSLGNGSFKRPTDPAVGCVTMAQALNIVIESLSIACGMHAPFSGLHLTVGTEQVMNQIFDRQSAFILRVIAQHRAEFDARVLTLPQLCLEVYISRTNRWNEPDLYRKLTEEWGLYDPVARAVLRLVKEAYDKLERAKLSAMSSQFSKLPPSQQLTHVVIDMLEDWDKVPEIMESVRQSNSDRDIEMLSDLLLQQWRLFGEAFGVTKPRYSPFGPQQRSSSQPEFEAEITPVMEVDEAPVVAASRRGVMSAPQ